MKNLYLALFLIFFLAESTFSQKIVITNDVLVKDVKKMGINLGSHDRWSAAQLYKNIIANPGFEDGEMASVFLNEIESSEGIFTVSGWNTDWNNEQYSIGMPEGFWDNADYEIVWGKSKGLKGKVKTFYHNNSYYTLQLENQSNTIIGKDDVIILRRKNVVTESNANYSFDYNEKSQMSGGNRSLKLSGNNWQSAYNFYMDSYWRDGDRSAGKLFPVKGNWIVKFWAKGKSDNDVLRVQFFREGNQSHFLNKTFQLKNEWAAYSFQFSVPDDADTMRVYTDAEYHPILGFKLIGDNQNAEIWVDDLELYSEDNTNPTAFTDKTVETLKELNPGILRNWSNQFGSSLDNQLASLHSRKASSYSPRSRNAEQFSYSLHEFLELCKEINAEPWYVIPPTFTDEEMSNLIEYLSAPSISQNAYAMKRKELGQEPAWTDVFPKIHLEYGNELWGAASGNDPFFGASVRGGNRLGAIANDKFAALKANSFYDEAKFNLIIGGQAGYADQNKFIEQNSTNHNSIALAPYFGTLDTWANNDDIYYPLFSSPILRSKENGVVGKVDKILKDLKKGTELSIYEINFHTTDGQSPTDTRNEFVSGMGGLSLSNSMLTYLKEFEIRNQCAFLLAGYSYKYMASYYVNVWGMMRDLEATGRKRPTFLGVEAINKVISGDMIKTEHKEGNPFIVLGNTNRPSWEPNRTDEIEMPFIQSFAFRNDSVYGLVLYNFNLKSSFDVNFQLPVSAIKNAKMWKVRANNIIDNNENAEMVKLEEGTLANDFHTSSLNLEPFSLTVLQWETAGGTSVETEESMNIYPNPAMDKVYINFEKLSQNNNAKLEIFNLLGDLMYQNTNFDQEKQIEVDISQFENAVYFVKLTYGEEQIFQKLVIRR